MLKTGLIFCLILTAGFSSFSQQLELDSTENNAPQSSAIFKLNPTEFNQGIIHSPLERINTGYLQPGGHALSINTQTWAEGIYVVKISHGNSVKFVRVIRR